MGMEMNYIKDKNFKYLFLFLPIIFWFIDFNATDNDFSFCIFKNTLNINCYGCGLSRGISAVLHLKYIEAIKLNNFNLITIPLIFYFYLKKVFQVINFYPHK
jgi:hypothetical protein